MKSFEITYIPRRLPDTILNQLVKVATLAHIHYNFPSEEFLIMEIRELIQ